MSAAIANICLDPRLDHAAIRLQVKFRLERLGLSAERIFITNEAGGNIGSSLRGAIDLLSRQNDEVVMAAVLHHDDCVAASAGMRRSLAEAQKALTDLLAGRSSRAKVLTGNILTDNSLVQWTDEPLTSAERFPFRMPSMFGR